jgi:replicative DNA helicase
VTAPEDDVLPPSNLEAEQSVLGAVMLSMDAAAEVAEILTPDDFYRPAHGQIMEAVLAVREAGHRPDAVTVAEELTRRGELIRIGGGPYLHTLLAGVATAANASYYAELVVQSAIRRRLMEAGMRITQLANLPGDAEEVVDRARAALDGIAERARGGVEADDIESLGLEALDRYTAGISNDALATPWADLNGCLNGGLRPGSLSVIGARPGVGKSAMAGNLCTYAAQGGVGALFVSLEMPRTEVTDRVLSALSRVEYGRLVSRRLSDPELDSVQNAVDRLGDMPLRVLDRPYMTLSRIRSVARSMARTPEGLGLLVVDYLQLIHPADPRAPRHEQVAASSRGLKLLAKELGIPVVALAQLNRNPEARADRRPSMSDLRESGQIEADADHILLLHRDPDDDARRGEIDVIVAKNRSGGTPSITMAWRPHIQQVSCLAGER